MSSGFVGLHVHSEFSYLDGRGRTDEIAKQAKDNGDEAVALTDHDEVGGHLAFQKSCRDAGIKPIFGVEGRWLMDPAQSREDKTRGLDNSHIVLLARDQVGLHNMWALSSLAYEKDNFYGKPQLNPDLLREYSEGLWASDGCMITEFARAVKAGDDEKARKFLGTLLGIFGDRFYMELHTWQIITPTTPAQKELNADMLALNEAKVRFATELGVPLVVVNDAHYAEKSQWEEHRLIWQMNTYKGDQTEEKGQAADWMMNTEELVEWMSRNGIRRSVTEEAIRNTAMIAEDCNVEIRPSLEMPRLYKTDADDNRAFIDAIEEGFKRKIIGRGLPQDLYLDQLDTEVGLIVDKGFAGYFNVVADYVMAAKTGRYIDHIDNPPPGRRACLCGPGRGSAPGSLVTYLMGITSLDPLHYELRFDRFLSEDRKDWPDIDVDFPKAKKPGVKEYLGKKFGEDRVVSIGTRSRSGPAQLVRDVGKAQGMSYSELDAIRKRIDVVTGVDYHDEDAQDEDEVTLADVVEADDQLVEMLLKYPRLVDKVVALDGLARQSGVHAAGVIVSNKPLLGNIPTRRKPGGKGTLATQFDMHELEALGAVKDDLLAVKHLDVCELAREYVYKRHGVWLDYEGEGYGVPRGASNVIAFGPEQYADPAIWEQIDQGMTAGVFQIGTVAGTKQAVKFQPRNEVELADLVSINRPGVIRAGLLNVYLRRRRGEEDVVFDHPMMEEITGSTHGVLVYQEQLMRAARRLAGFTGSEAEALRKIIGKKKIDQMHALEPKFIAGCLANEAFTDGLSRTEADRIARKIWASLLASGSYAFNKSHAMGYAIEACWEIWTKHYYFTEFIAACMSVDPGKMDVYLREVRRTGRTVLPPDVNRSDGKFGLTEEGLRYGLESIVGVGEAATRDVEAKRPFMSLEDYLGRCTSYGGAKKGVIDSFIKIGAFDWTGRDRQDMLEQVYRHRRIEKAPTKWAKMTDEEREADFAEWRAKAPDEYPTFDFSDPKVVMEIEQGLVGDFVSLDPMGAYHDRISAECVHHAYEIEDKATGDRFKVGGQVSRVKTHKQRNGAEMAFLTITWRGEDFEILAFADAWMLCRSFLEVGSPVLCSVIKLKDSGAHLSTVEKLESEGEVRE